MSYTFPNSRKPGISIPARVALCLLFLAVCSSQTASADQATKKPLCIVIFGTSLSDSPFLKQSDRLAERLRTELNRAGYYVEIHDRSAPMRTTAMAVNSLDTVLPLNPDIVIVELGANDALQKVEPQVVKHNLEEILNRFKQDGITVLLCGMYAPPSNGLKYFINFRKIYNGLPCKYETVYFPFFLEDVAMRKNLNLPDGIHPNAQGTAIIARNMLPYVKKSIELTRRRER